MAGWRSPPSRPGAEGQGRPERGALREAPQRPRAALPEPGGPARIRPSVDGQRLNSTPRFGVVTTPRRLRVASCEPLESPVNLVEVREHIVAELDDPAVDHVEPEVDLGEPAVDLGELASQEFDEP